MSHISRDRMTRLREFVRNQTGEFTPEDVQKLLGCCRQSALAAMKLLGYEGKAKRVSGMNRGAVYRRVEC